MFADKLWGALTPRLTDKKVSEITTADKMYSMCKDRAFAVHFPFTKAAEGNTVATAHIRGRLMKLLSRTEFHPRGPAADPKNVLPIVRLRVRHRITYCCIAPYA